MRMSCRGKVDQTSSRVCDEIVHVFLLVNEAVVTTDAEVGGRIPSNYSVY